MAGTRGHDTALRVAVCEDTPREASALIHLIQESGVACDVRLFHTGESFIDGFTKGAYDILFLDVYMGEVSGIEVAERVRAVDEGVVIVFTTTSEDFTKDGYRLNAYKYMLKPVRASDVAESLELAALKRDRAQGAQIAVVADGRPITLSLDDIEYVEANNRSVSIHMVNGDLIPAQGTIDALDKMLPSPRFLRSHRSYIVNLDHVADVSEDFIMDSGDVADIRVKERRSIQHAYDDYLFKNARGDV
jgi:DNA-binding LytR/AlgR family response regulator